MKTQINNSNGSKQPKISTKKRKIILGIVITLIVTPLLAAMVALVGFAIYSSTVTVDDTLLPTATATPTFYDINGRKIAYEEDDFVSPSEVTDNLKYAFIATEDKRFFKHNGVDVVRIGGAILHDIKAGKLVEGASTITQQLVKNTHLTHERTLKRKLNEIAIALKLEKKYSKDEILSMYLSVIYFGNGVYGVKSAAKYYFDKYLTDLTIDECATLAAIVKNPSKYSPNKNPESSKSRRNFVLDKMFEQNYISLECLNHAKSADTVTKQADEQTTDTLRDADLKIYIDNAVQEACEALNITKYQLSNGGYKIYTNLNPALQLLISKELKNASSFDDSENRIIMLADTDGKVLAYSSTLGYNPRRQLGSAIKPILYSSALDKGIISLATPIVDEQIDYSGYSPKNFGGKYYGMTMIKDAIAKSMNSVAVKTCDFVGVDEYFDYVKRFGLNVNDEDKNFSLALGATMDGVSPLEVLSAYTTFPNNGVKSECKFLRYILKDGEKIYTAHDDAVRIIRPSTAQLINTALIETVKNGTAKSLSYIPLELAAKTGTAEREDGLNSDAWCVSFVKNYVLLVWHGSDVGMNEKGGGYPAMQSANVWSKLKDFSESGAELDYSLDGTFDTDEIFPAFVDLYSTFRSQRVILASDNVPLEYRKTEHFAFDNLPSADGSYFDDIIPPDFDVEINNGVVKVSFDAEKIYEYDLIRTDIFGSRIIKHLDSENVDLSNVVDTSVFTCNVEVVDHPLTFVGFVNYRLEVKLKNNPSIKNASAKTIFVGATFG